MRFKISQDFFGWRPEGEPPCDGAEQVDGGWIIDVPSADALLALAIKYSDHGVGEDP